MLCGNASIHVKTTAKNIYFNQFIFQQQCMVFCTCQRVQYTAQKAEKFFTLFLIKRKTIVCWHFFFSLLLLPLFHILLLMSKKKLGTERKSLFCGEKIYNCGSLLNALWNIFFFSYVHTGSVLDSKFFVLAWIYPWHTAVWCNLVTST